MNNIMDLIDFERRGEYVLADVKLATWFLDRGEYVLADVKSATWIFECDIEYIISCIVRRAGLRYGNLDNCQGPPTFGGPQITDFIYAVLLFAH
jgi:hypothetical protein